MNVASPEAICDFVSTPIKEIDEASQRHNIKSSVAKVVRSHWKRRLLGRCVRCGTPVNEGKCSSCGTTAQPAVETITTLQKVDPKTVLMRRQCVKCKREFNHTVGRVMTMLKKHGQFIPSHVCPKCKAPKKKVKKAAKPKSKGRRNENLVHRPFMVLKELQN